MKHAKHFAYIRKLQAIGQKVWEQAGRPLTNGVAFKHDGEDFEVVAFELSREKACFGKQTFETTSYDLHLYHYPHGMQVVGMNSDPLFDWKLYHAS